MKKFLFLFLFISLATGFIAAQEESEGIGLSTTLEFGIVDVNDSDAMYPYIYAGLEYEKSFADGVTDLYLGLGYESGFLKDGGNIPMFLYFDFMVGLNIGIGNSSTLSFLFPFENTLDFTDGADLSGTFTPGIKYNLSLNAGDIYFQANLPFTYTDETFGLDFIAGWASSFGLGLEASAHTLFNPNVEFTGIGFLATYDVSIISVGLNVTIPIKMYNPYSFFDSDNGEGVAIIPGIAVSVLDWLSIYGNCTFSRIGGKIDGVKSGVGISFAVGLTFSF